MSVTSDCLAKQRTRASDLSGGISSDTIYARIEKIIEEKQISGRILDYGAGVGHLTRRLVASKRFEQVCAVDLMRIPSDLAGRVEWTHQDLNSPLQSSGGTFDVVVAAEVIEHLENPRQTMREIFRLLRPGGAAIISTPNNESWRSLGALLVRGHYVAFGDSCYPAHITPLLRKDLERIFTEVKFPAPEFFFTDEGGIPAWPSVTWQTISLGLLRGLRFSDNIIAAAKKPGTLRDH
jgi:2-polyprenyl-3-methyl-5-hydroxy-6-metoxy-1,4-benzoquinol methylase